MSQNNLEAELALVLIVALMWYHTCKEWLTLVFNLQGASLLQAEIGTNVCNNCFNRCIHQLKSQNQWWLNHALTPHFKFLTTLKMINESLSAIRISIHWDVLYILVNIIASRMVNVNTQESIMNYRLKEQWLYTAGCGQRSGYNCTLWWNYKMKCTYEGNNDD